MKPLYSRLIIFMLCYFLLPVTSVKAQREHPSTLKQEMAKLQDEHNVSFVYDATLNVSQAFRGKSISGMKLGGALKALFDGTGISFKQEGKYIVLHKDSEINRKKHYTLSGYMYQKNGESLINATVIDIETGTGTVTNSYGFFSLTLPEGNHDLRFSYVGMQASIQKVEMNKDSFLKVYLEELPSLKEIVVMGQRDTPLAATQPGKVSLTNKDLNTAGSLLSSPDLIKDLQSLPGVTPGTELVSGLFVHGGSNDENLFLLDGTPLYQINHVGGLFSAFNTEIVKNVDFYKGGFPARYGGRLSSIVDVRTMDGDMDKFHGSYSIGLLDGRVHLEGPLDKGRTSFIFGMRRSWVDPFMMLASKIGSLADSESKFSALAYFHDINAKVSHLFSDRSKLSVEIYSGKDRLKSHTDQDYKISSGGSQGPTGYEKDKFHFDLTWGNFTTSANWNYQLNPKLFSNFTAVYTHNQSLYDYMNDERTYTLTDQKEQNTYHFERHNHSTIDDIGYRSEFDYRPNPRHHIRFGSNYLFHSFRPLNNKALDFSGNEGVNDTLSYHQSNQYHGHELTLYGEDDIKFNDKLNVNIGLHNTLFIMDGKTYHSVEPRLALKYLFSRHSSVKLSYTEMNQYMHQISNSYLNLPTDFWVSSTKKVQPMYSRQVTAGIYTDLPWKNLHLDLEGYYKTMNNLVEYYSGNNLIPDAAHWEDLIETGKGRSYGMECALSYQTNRNTLNASYTLSWTQRKFPSIYSGWYDDKYDNRHKFVINWRSQVSKKTDIYASWTFHSGNKMTIPTQYVTSPAIPNNEGKENYIEGEWIYEKPNNLSMPAYHRLDIGANFHHVTKHGNERIWNISIYNAYCRLNSLFTKVNADNDGTLRAKNYGYFPIIPSFSYTIKF